MFLVPQESKKVSHVKKCPEIWSAAGICDENAKTTNILLYFPVLDFCNMVH